MHQTLQSHSVVAAKLLLDLICILGYTYILQAFRAYVIKISLNSFNVICTFANELLSEPMLIYDEWDLLQQNKVKFRSK